MNQPRPTATAYLVPRTPRPGLEEKFPICPPQVTVGRHPSNTIALALDSISRFHARIDIRGSHYILQDLNSSNGTFVNGEQISSATLHDGDLVVFGNVDFQFVNEASSQRAVKPASPQVQSALLDVLDSAAAPSHPVATKVIRAEEARDTSSYISSTGATDRQTLLKVNNRLATLYSLSELLRESAGLTEKEILKAVLELLFESVSADRGAILTRFSRDAKEFDVAVVKYRDQPILDQKVSVSRTILDRVVNERVAVLSSDAQADDRFHAAESIIMHNIRSTMCVPMISEGRVLGVVHLDTQSARRQFAEDDLEFVTTMATEVAVSLENMRMREERIHRQRLAAVGETVAGISHNVKNILLLSQGGMELLDRACSAGDIEQIRESWAVVRRGIDKIGKLVKDMLDYSKTRKPKLAPVDINEMICHIAEEIEEQLLKKNVRMELELDDSLAQFKTDEHGVNRTLTNLIVNAAESITHSEGLIQVATELAPDGNLIIRVRDNGCGIPPDKIERIFFPFFTTKGSRGTGLGLPMCKKVIEEDLGGTISVESIVGEGTAFTMLLPPNLPAGTVAEDTSA
jgi:signal transduction histidine kinase/pSer/pThr/pTyr-binding forkhead associated (FHA) protein